MEIRPIDANALIEWIMPYLHTGDTVEVDTILEDIRAQPTLSPQWISVEDRLPEAEKEVWIACKTKPSGYLYQCVGFYIPNGFFQEDSDYTWDYEALGEYSEERDDYCINEGWYERVHNWDDYGAVVIGDFVTHWIPLPQPPKEAQP